MKRPIYLDHLATTPCDPRVVAAMLPYLTEHFGNAGSRTHQYGWAAEEAGKLAREHVAADIEQPRHLREVLVEGIAHEIRLEAAQVVERPAGHQRLLRLDVAADALGDEIRDLALAHGQAVEQRLSRDIHPVERLLLLRRQPVDDPVAGARALRDQFRMC